MAQKKKVLVIGGTGITGQSIVDYLLLHEDLCELFIASRGFHKMANRNIGFVKIDIFDTYLCESVVKQFDIVILALGSFPYIGTGIYTMCLENGIICIDINDDYKQYERLLEIKDRASIDSQGSVFTGMGLCPGLTTFMLEHAVMQLEEDVLDAELRFYFGAGVPSGTASISHMFENFKEELMVLSEKTVRNVTPSKYRPNSLFTFDDSHSDMPLIFFSSPEVKTLRRSARFESLANFDCAFHLQNLPMGIVPLLRNSSWIRKLFCKIVNKQQGRLYKNIKNEKSVIVCADVESRNFTVRCSLHSDSSFKLTGAFCAAVAVSIIRGEITVRPGVFSFEDIKVSLDMLDKCLIDSDINMSIKKNYHV